MNRDPEFAAKHGQLAVRAFDLEVKALDENGVFTGYGSVFNVVDSYNEVVAPGAFKASLDELAAKKRKVPVLWQHSSSQPLGVYEELREDDTGLWVRGRLLKDEVAQAREAFALMKAGAVTGLSIGYWTRKSAIDDATHVRTLLELDLVEVSLVTFPANDDARVENVKFKLAHGELPTLPEFERFLREAGFSKSQAAAVAGRGLAHLLRSESEGAASKAEGLKALLDEVAGFSLPRF